MTKMAKDDNGHSFQALGLEGTSQLLATTTSNVASAAVADNCTAFRIVVSVPSYIRVGAAAAVGAAAYLPADTVEYFAIQGGQTVNVIGSAGFAHITEMT